MVPKQTMTMTMTMTKLAAVVLLGGATAAQAGVIAEHSGSTDPETEGFSIVDGNGGVSTGPVHNDGAANNVEAWKVNDNTDSGFGIYFVGKNDLTASQKTDITDNGFLLTSKLRVVGTDQAPGTNSIKYRLSVPDKRDLTILFGSDANGNLKYELVAQDLSNDPTGTVNGSGYHTVNVAYDPVNENFDFYVDGNEEVSDFAARSNAGKNVQFYFGSSGTKTGDTGQGNYSLFRVETPAPEPASLALMGLGGLALLSRRRAARR